MIVVACVTKGFAIGLLWFWFGVIALGVIRFDFVRIGSGITGSLAHDGLDASCQGSAAQNR